jgi:hypothetical protein
LLTTAYYSPTYRYLSLSGEKILVNRPIRVHFNDRLGNCFGIPISSFKKRIAQVPIQFSAYINKGDARTSVGARLYMWEVA